ncbi:hypothetical protein FSP39_006716 [Pinctada imbricata]|uniref:RRM domain-containing protein n=1 Tax=Pinctada imbricata TaxID=66713 RepID=A0AA88XVB7_PINIB|nr:hypothetical protein FSP39_006716 [Pinctada imbricata]
MSTRVYIGRLPYHVRERDVERFFKGYGHIRDIMLKNGYGFVEFDDYRDADDAVYELNGKDLCGERVSIEHARGAPRGGGRGGRSSYSYREKRPPPGWIDKYGPPTRTENRLIVENLSSRVSWQDLKDYMRQAGEVTFADAHKQHRNEGVVEFATSSDLRNAVRKLDGTEINGRKIKLVEDRPRSRRSRSRSRSRSRRRSRSRSRSHSRSRSRSRGRDSRGRDSRSASRSRSRSKSKSPEVKKSKSRSKSRSRSPDEEKRSWSHEKSHSRSKSRSPMQEKENDEEDH